MLPYTSIDLLRVLRASLAPERGGPPGDGTAIIPFARPRRALGLGLLALALLLALAAGVPDAGAAQGASFKAGPVFTDFGPELGVTGTVAGLQRRTDARVVVRASVTLVAQCLDPETGAPLPLPQVLVSGQTLEGARTIPAREVKPGGTPFLLIVRQGYLLSAEDVGCPPSVVFVPDVIFHDATVEVYQGGSLVLSQSFAEPVG